MTRDEAIRDLREKLKELADALEEATRVSPVSCGDRFIALAGQADHRWDWFHIGKPLRLESRL